MRPRDVRAIIFCIATTVGLFVLLLALTHAYLVALGASLAYGAFILTRPRMIRVFRRMRGDPDWSGYYDNGGTHSRTRVSPRAPEAPAGNPRPAGRR